MQSIMKKHLFYLIITLILIITSFSCNKPSEDLETINIFYWIKNKIGKFNQINLKPDKQKTFIKDEIRNNIELIAFYRNSTIKLHTKEEKKGDFAYSLNNNSFILKKSIYITLENKQLYVSQDKKIWMEYNNFDADSDFRIDYRFDTVINEEKKDIDIFLTAGVAIKDNPKKIIKINDKPMFYLKPNMLLIDGKNKNTPTIDLEKTMLYIPENTILSGEIVIRGNIFNGKTTPDTISITSLRDLFIYINKKKLNVSFDRYNWNLTIASLLKLKFERKLIVKSLDANKIHLKLDVYLNFND